MNEQLHLSDKHRAIVESILRTRLPTAEVWAYGSRVNGRSHDGSDLDLVLRNEDLAPLNPALITAVAQAFQESNIPFLVEARDWARLPHSFHAEIERNHVVLIALSRKGDTV